VDGLISNAPGHRATLGILQQAMALSISYGAPAWNADDHDACAKFYVKTGESLCSAFAGNDAATPAARGILDDLKSALVRVKKSDDADANAWAMRFVFDKTEAMMITQADQSARMLALGQETMARSQFEDAANAFNAAADVLHELDGIPIENIPPTCRYAPIALSDALFGQRKYKEAAAAIEEGLRFVPELPDDKMDLRKHFADPALYKLLADDLSNSAANNPKDAGIQMLAGYHLFFTGHPDTAKPFFEKVLELDPKDSGAKRMMEQYDPAHPKPAGKQALPPAVGV
jgi:tetratricopeptide (TPR) repeat protein